MRLQLMRAKNGRRSMNWGVLALMVLAIHALFIGGTELVWYLLTGGVSPLLGLFAFVIALLGVFRVIIEAYSRTDLMIEAPADVSSV